MICLISDFICSSLVELEKQLIPLFGKQENCWQLELWIYKHRYVRDENRYVGRILRLFSPL